MTTPTPFSIVPLVNIDQLPAPESGPYIVATKKGYYVYRDFHFGRVLVPTSEAPLTPEGEPTLWHNFDEQRIPHEIIGQAFSFFKTIYEKRKSEAMVDITWSPDRGYRLFVPPQRATGGGVKATRTPEHYRGHVVGTIHSHCNFNAFHSPTDTHDADGHDGLHITIGDVLKDQPTIAIMISVASKRWNFKLDEISDGPLKLIPHPEWWERYVNDPEPTSTTQTWNKQEGWKPAGAVGAWSHTRPTGPITGPTKQNPTVVSQRPNANSYQSFSLEALTWRYGDAFDANETAMIDGAAELIYEIQEGLQRLGIEMECEFSINLNAPKLLTTSDDDERTTQP
jgi:hypothetical protein